MDTTPKPKRRTRPQPDHPEPDLIDAIERALNSLGDQLFDDPDPRPNQPPDPKRPT